MVKSERSNAILIENVVKSYNSNLVLNGLNLKVGEGTIYGLLGPSGCGKTTALSCIAGVCGMDSGQIQLSIQHKGQIGFMPQKSGLFGELTFEETFYFNGRINFMDKETIKARITDLTRLLHLPEVSGFVKSVSGGQEKRISLAVALFHDPQILLLDEPTVGLDPILHHSIWQYLKQLVEMQKKTILLTTHYIEEAASADSVGYLMDGILLEESPPQQILQKYSLNSLEDVFLHLSVQHKKLQREGESKTIKDRRKKQTCSPLLKNSGFSITRLNAQIIKNVTWFKRSIFLIIYLGIITPLLCSVFVFETIGRNPHGLKIGTVHAGGIVACANHTVGCYSYAFDCHLIEKLRLKSYKVIEFKNYTLGLNAVVHNDVWAMINFPINFTSSIIALSYSGLDAEDSLLENSVLNISMDKSNSIIAAQIMKDLKDIYYDVLKDLFIECGWPEESSNIPVKFEKPLFGKNDIQFTRFAVPGMICLFPFLFACLFSMATILMEKLSGVIERSMVTGLLWSEFLIAHIIVVLIFLLLNVGVTFFVMFGYYQEIHHGYYIISYFITYLQGVSGMCCGILIAVVCNAELVASQALVSLILLCSFGSGAFWPIEGMHWFARMVSYCLPITIPLQSIRHVIDRGWSLTYYPVYIGILFSILWISIFMSISTIFLYKKTKLVK